MGQDTYVLEPNPSERLLEFCQEQGISLNNLLLMGLRTYLSKQCDGQKDISLRCYVSRRTSKLDRKAGGSRIHVFPLPHHYGTGHHLLRRGAENHRPCRAGFSVTRISIP